MTDPVTTSASSASIEQMHRIDEVLSHIWMVRTFLKHSDEATEDEELAEVHRELYDYMLALGPAFKANDAEGYLALAKKKFAKLKRAQAKFAEIQNEVSTHTNFQMANQSLAVALRQLGELLGTGLA